jgi:small conductance mechanosensitive channel
VSASALVERASELGGRIALAVAVTIGFVLVGRLLAPLVRRILDRRGRPSYTRVFVGLFRVVVVLIGVLVALTLAFPSVRVADVLAIFGILSVAAGFAFKDTFENLLAGVLLMLRDPFKSGDQVTVAGTTGTVEGVTVRETLLRGHDGRRYFVPNAKVMTDVIDVETDRTAVRQVFDLPLDRTCDLQRIRTAISEALTTADGVLAEPAPDAVVTDVVDGDPVLTCRFWAGSTRAESTAARDAAITAVLARFVADDVPTPTTEHRVIIATDTEADSHGLSDNSPSENLSTTKND